MLRSRGLAPRVALRAFGSSDEDTSDYVFDVETVDQFDKKVIKSSIPMLLMFHASWCGPCKQLKPILRQAVEA